MAIDLKATARKIMGKGSSATDPEAIADRLAEDWRVLVERLAMETDPSKQDAIADDAWRPALDTADLVQLAVLRRTTARAIEWDRLAQARFALLLLMRRS